MTVLQPNSVKVNMSLTSLIQTSQAYPMQQILSQNPSYMYKLVDYISILPDPLLQNQRQCYFYPLKAVQVLNSIGVYRILIKKQQDTMNIDATVKEKDEQKGSKKYFYPFLDRLFKNLRSLIMPKVAKKQLGKTQKQSGQGQQEMLLGYIDKLLHGVTKKTPEVTYTHHCQIYEFIKDNEQYLMLILKNDTILFAFKQFLTLFLTESTMQLYVFIKNLILRTLMFRIVQEENVGSVVYQVLDEFYTQLLKCYSGQLTEQEKEQISQVLKNIEEQNFIALLVLKISWDRPHISYSIAKLLNSVVLSPNNSTNLIIPYVDTYSEYLQAYEQSQSFMSEGIKPDQLMMLKLMVRAVNNTDSTQLLDIKQELTKRLLVISVQLANVQVYCNVYDHNSILHNMFFSMLEILQAQGLTKIIVKQKVVEFLKNNYSASSSYNFKGIVRRVCRFIAQKDMIKQFQSQSDKEFIESQCAERDKALLQAKYFKPQSNQPQLKQGRSKNGDEDQNDHISEIQKTKNQMQLDPTKKNQPVNNGQYVESLDKEKGAADQLLKISQAKLQKGRLQEIDSN